MLEAYGQGERPAGARRAGWAWAVGREGGLPLAVGNVEVWGSQTKMGWGLGEGRSPRHPGGSAMGVRSLGMWVAEWALGGGPRDVCWLWELGRGVILGEGPGVRGPDDRTDCGLGEVIVFSH